MKTIFDLHKRVLKDYSDFVGSFFLIADDRARTFVEKAIKEEASLWPDPLIQVSPCYAAGGLLTDLARERLIQPTTATIFGGVSNKPLRLYRHQDDAIRKALRGESFVLTSGTGSGKSLCYFLPIVESLLRQPETGGRVAALLVYPMNALVNSQYQTLERLKKRFEDTQKKPFPITFAKYTGDTLNEERDRMRQHPPQVMLTNYVMAELLLVRREDQRFLEGSGGGLRFLVFDELHTYRGRQGADVAMLVRRLKERCAGENLVHIGTSATMVGGSTTSSEKRREVVRDFAQRFFGHPFTTADVIEETLETFTRGGMPTAQEVAERLKGSEWDSWDNLETFPGDPLVRWVEYELGVEKDEEGRLKRRAPRTLSDAAKGLAQFTGVSEETCREKIREVLSRGAALKREDGNRALSFKLHQFISQGQTLYATLQDADTREFSLDGQMQTDDGRLLAPVKFCRCCGQEYYHVVVLEDRFLPHAPDREEDEETVPGFLMVAPKENDWNKDMLPEEWYDANGRLKQDWRQRVPQAVWVATDGTFSKEPRQGFCKMWLQENDFYLCLNCGEFYTNREREFTKLATLSSEGRSSATTVLATGLLRYAAEIPGVKDKLLTFTDNRQDASLQAGHFNDFIHVGLLRAALYAALKEKKELRFDEVASEVVRCSGLTLQDYAKTAELREDSKAAADVQATFIELTEYRLYEDLRRGWRVTQPNLEHVGLLRMEYRGLEEICDNPTEWSFHKELAGKSPETRRELIRAVLDHFRRKLAIGARVLEETTQKQLKKRAENYLNEFWGLDPDINELRQAQRFVLYGKSLRPREGISLGPRSSLGRFLRRELGLDETSYLDFIGKFLYVLEQHGMLKRLEPVNDHQFYQLDPGCLRWCLGDGTAPPPDPLYTRRAHNERYARNQRPVNEFFQRIYQEGAGLFVGFEAREHTAQVVTPGEREQRERRFRWAANDTNLGRRLPYLVCSPTMELGVDIADLEMVHLRNVPPTPANYAQRSGRAGRQGQPGLVMTYCGARSNHDQYFFRHSADMVAGNVRAPNLDIANEALLRSHIHSIWLAHIGLPLGHSIEDTIDINKEDFPLKENVACQISRSASDIDMLADRVRQVLASDAPLLARTSWFTDAWVKEVLRETPESFDRAFDRWRELYRTASQQLKNARNDYDRARQKHVQEEAQRQELEAKRQLNLLLQIDSQREESDFYPYRYLASEGFLPGYNFPALPVRAWVPRGEGEYLSRPRFLAIREFAPNNIIYHEGAKYESISFIAPPGGLEERKSKKRLCKTCGAFCEPDLDLCPVCHTRFDASNSRLETLLEMPNVKTKRRERITSDEEERRRSGYRLELFYQFPPTSEQEGRIKDAEVQMPGGTVLRLKYVQTGTLLRINHGWRKAKEEGFLIDFETGEVQSSDSFDFGRRNRIHVEKVSLAVQNVQNLLLVQSESDDFRKSEVVVTLQYALQRGIEQAFQVEESELASERVGQDEHQAILFYETSEGGSGVLRRLVEEPSAMAEVARAALERCHFTVQDEDLKPECIAACYECLLSFNNQLDALSLDRRRIRQILLDLSKGKTWAYQGGRPREKHLEWLRSLVDSRSELERRFLDALVEGNCRLPDDAQKSIDEPRCIPDFFYEPNVCTFCDGSVHNDPEQRKKDQQLRQVLVDRGYRVIVIRYDQDIQKQIEAHRDVFC